MISHTKRKVKIKLTTDIQINVIMISDLQIRIVEDISTS